MDAKKDFCETSCKSLFEKYDTDKDGFISSSELLKAAENCPDWKKQGVDKAQVEKCLAKFDKNNDHKLNCEEFCTMMKNCHCGDKAACDKGACDKTAKVCDKGACDKGACDKTDKGVCDKTTACDKGKVGMDKTADVSAARV